MLSEANYKKNKIAISECAQKVQSIPILPRKEKCTLNSVVRGFNVDISSIQSHPPKFRLMQSCEKQLTTGIFGLLAGCYNPAQQELQAALMRKVSA